MLDAQRAAPPGAAVAIGAEAAVELIETVDADVVLNAITGSVGLAPTLAALRAGRTLALANKESLVAGGRLVTDAAAPGQIVPVDSEHSALAQCLRSGAPAEVRSLVLTASGGPFRGRTAEQMRTVTARDALAHPTWDMGPVVTINSATLVNKGLEVIEAHLLFGVPYDRIEVVVHPQSVIHSMVTFVDGATIAQASPPDMRLPIALALAWPDRLDPVIRACDFTAPASWTFEPVTAWRSRRWTWRSRRAARAARCRPPSTPRTRRPSTPSAPGICDSQASRTCSGASWTSRTAGGTTRASCPTSGTRKSGPASAHARSSSRSRRPSVG